MNSPKLILASGSPRRRQLLEQLGLTFAIEPPDIDETLNERESAQDYVTRLSAEKAATVSSRHPESVILAADTTVVLGDRILGKPVDREDGIAMLTALSDTSHDVLTGVTVSSGQQRSSICICTNVQFRKLNAEEMVYYWGTGEPADKAGGYGLQGIGAVFVESLTGSYTNVIGLPLPETVALLRAYGISCLGSQDIDVAKPLQGLTEVQDSHHG